MKNLCCCEKKVYSVPNKVLSEHAYHQGNPQAHEGLLCVLVGDVFLS